MSFQYATCSSLLCLFLLSSSAIAIPAATLNTTQPSPPVMPLSHLVSDQHISWTDNMIVNGDAESAISDWSIVRGDLDFKLYKSLKSFIRERPAPPPDSGAYYFTGGQSDETITTQHILLPSTLYPLTDNGSLYYHVSGYFGGYSSQNDVATLNVTFYNQQGQPTGHSSIGDVNAQMRGGKTLLMKKEHVARAPIGTRSMNVTLILLKEPKGKTNDAYADNLQLCFGRVLDGKSDGTLSIQAGSLVFNQTHPTTAAILYPATESSLKSLLNQTEPESHTPTNTSLSTPAIVGISISVSAVVIMAIVIGVCISKKRQTIHPSQPKKTLATPSLPQQPEPTVKDAHANDIPLPKPGSKFRVLRRYVPTREDELVLIVGDDVVVEESYSDGWAYGTSCFSQATGHFPIACVVSIDCIYSSK